MEVPGCGARFGRAAAADVLERCGAAGHAGAGQGGAAVRASPRPRPAAPAGGRRAAPGLGTGLGGGGGGAWTQGPGRGARGAGRGARGAGRGARGRAAGWGRGHEGVQGYFELPGPSGPGCFYAWKKAGAAGCQTRTRVFRNGGSAGAAAAPRPAVPGWAARGCGGALPARCGCTRWVLWCGATRPRGAGREAGGAR
jgi:hypothetical protein